MAILYVGIDLAKNVFALHGVDEAGAARLKQPKVARGELNAAVAALPPCVIGVEACSGAHYTKDLRQSQRDACETGNGLRHEAPAPILR
jgi:transposase